MDKNGNSDRLFSWTPESLGTGTVAMKLKDACSLLGLDWCWSWNSNTLATSCKALTSWKRPWCCEGLGAGGEGDDRGWDGWMASPTRWAWVWVNSRSLRSTGSPGIHWVTKSRSRLSDWTELNWTAPWKKSYNKTRQGIKKQKYHFVYKSLNSQIYGFYSNHVWLWVLNHEKGWESKNWCFQTLVLEKTLESPLDSKEVKPVNPKGNQPWISIRN